MKYQKVIRKHSKVYAHDEAGKAKVGDVVRVVECRPFSRLKRFYVAGFVETKAKGSA